MRAHETGIGVEQVVRGSLSDIHVLALTMPHAHCVLVFRVV